MHFTDSDNKTDLDKTLKEKGVNTVFLCRFSSVRSVLATWIGAQNCDYNKFMIKDAIISRREDSTKNTKAMFDTVGLDVISIILYILAK